MIGYWECGLMAFEIKYGIDDIIVVGFDVDHKYEFVIMVENDSDRSYIQCDDDRYYLDECIKAGGVW